MSLLLHNSDHLHLSLNHNAARQLPPPSVDNVLLMTFGFGR